MNPVEIINQNEDQIKSRILNHLEKDFSNHGFRNFALDKMASELHLSKKTIYKYFQTKEELIRVVLIKQLNIAYREVVIILQSQSSIIEKLMNLSIVVEQFYSAFNETSIERLKHYFKDLADYNEQFRIHRIIPLINLMLKDGKTKELILDIPDEIIIKVFTSVLGAIAKSNTNNFSNFSYHQTFRQAFDILLNGILTKKGKQLLNNKLEVIK